MNVHSSFKRLSQLTLALFLAVAGLAMISILTSYGQRALAHSADVDANGLDWSMAGPGQDNLGHIGRDTAYEGEYVWRDAAGDERIDVASPDPRVDLLEFRVTADEDNLYFMAVMSDVTQATGDGAPQVQVAIDIDRVSGSGQTEMAGGSEISVTADAAWEYLVVTPFGSATGPTSDTIVYQGGLATRVWTGAAAISATSEVIEVAVPWTALEMSAPPTLPLRFTVATFRADTNDDAVEVAGADALDAVTNYGDPGDTSNTSVEVTDGVIDYYFDLFFEPDGDVYPPLLISEVYYDATGTDTDNEWVEIYNNFFTAVSLDEFKIGDEETPDAGAGDGMAQFPAGYSISPGTVAIVALRTTDGGSEGFENLYGFKPDFETNSTDAVVPDMNVYGNWDTTANFSLANTGDEVLLLDGSDTVLDVVAYEGASWPGVSNTAIAAGTGESIERVPANWDTNDMSVDFRVHVDEGDPGAAITSDDDLSVVKFADPDPAVAGLPLTYTIVVRNTAGLSITDAILTDTLHTSTTLQTLDQTDDTAAEFNMGTYTNTQWTDPRPVIEGDERLELVDAAFTGSFESRVFDAGNIASWTTLSWRPDRPYWKPLPDNGGEEWGYVHGEANMTGNRVLLHMDSLSGSRITDTSGFDNHGFCPARSGEACPSFVSGYYFNGGLSFNGAFSQTVVITDALDPQRYAVEMWVWVPPGFEDDTTSFILRTDTPTDTAANYSHLMGIVDGHFQHTVYDGAYRTVTSTVPVTPGIWHHVAGTAQGGGDLELYVDGVRQGRLSGLGTLWTGGDWYRLGSAYGITGTTYFTGGMDEVAIYSRTLSSGEILDHYLRGGLRLYYQVRSCDDPVCAGESFSGFYSEQTNTGLTRPTNVPLSGVSDNRYFQYRVFFEANPAGYSPRLRSVTVGPAHRAISSTQGNCAYPAGGQAFTCTLGTVDTGDVVTITAWTNVHPSALGVITNTAWVTGTGDINPANNLAVVTTTVESHVGLRIHKRDDEEYYGGMDPVNPGSPMTYTLEVHNAGPSTAWDVIVTDTLPITVTGVSAPGGWTVAFTTHTITCTTPHLLPHTWPDIIVTGIAPTELGIITNTAWIAAPGSTIITATSHLSDTETTLVTPLADLQIEKEPSPNPAESGGVLTYTITVTNLGPSDAENVAVVETLQPGFIGHGIDAGDWTCSPPANVVTCTLGTSLTVGMSSTLHLTTTAPVSGTIWNMAAVESTTYDPELDNNLVFIYTSVRPTADLAVTKADTPDPVLAGETLTYTVVVSNTGPTPAGAVDATLTATNAGRIRIPWGGRASPYPSSLYVTGVPGRVRDITVTLRVVSHTYTADIVALLVGPDGQSVVLMSNVAGGTDTEDITLTINDGGTAMPLTDPLTSTRLYRPTNYGLGGDLPTSAPAGPYGGSLSAFSSADPNGAWRLYVYDSVGSDGGNFWDGWSLQITTRTTDTVTLTDTLPVGLTGVSVAGIPATGWACSTAGNLFACDVDTIAVDDPTTLTIVATAPITGGIITNTVTITSTTYDPDPTSNTATVTTTVIPVADLGIEKLSTPMGTVGMGQPLTYTLVISNAGPSPVLDPIVVTDQLPAELDTVVPSGVGWTCDLSAQPLLTCTLDGGLAADTISEITLVTTAPLTRGLVLTNTATVTATVSDPDPGNNTAFVTITVIDVPIAGLHAFNDSPTAIGYPTTLWATVDWGTNITYEWSLGYGTAQDTGETVVHTYPAVGEYTAIVTATNSVNTMTATTTISITNLTIVYLPVVMRNYAVAPDLVVEQITASGNSVQVVIRNEGDAPVEDEFWVDAYLNPTTPPTAVNQTWQHVGDHGIVWGVTSDALPLYPGDAITLTVTPAGGDYYHAGLSNVSWPLVAGTQVYAQADSAHTETSYGGVMENHEITGGTYNNISGPITSTDASNGRPAPLALQAPWPAQRWDRPQIEKKVSAQ
jgi:uncharacterized repeat protein (TIGR01451 family)